MILTCRRSRDGPPLHSGHDAISKIFASLLTTSVVPFALTAGTSGANRIRVSTVLTCACMARIAHTG